MASIGDAAAKSVAKFISKTFWPWFLKNIWPLIATELVGFLAERIGELTETAGAAVRSKYDARAAKAQESASEADRLATEATTSAEREKHQATAQAWRTVAEQLHADNEQLRAQLSALAIGQQDASEAELRSLTPLLDRDGAEISLSIGGSRTPLPALPSSSTALEA